MPLGRNDGSNIDPKWGSHLGRSNAKEGHAGPSIMRMAKVPINADVLKWAIEDAGVDAVELAHRCSLSADSLEDWMSGDESPNTTELRKLASKLGRSLQFFMLPEPPAQSSIDVRFRKSLHDDALEPEKESAALRSARRAQSFIRWTEVDVDAANILERTSGEAASAYAARLKEHLGWTTTMQKRATSKSAVFRELRDRADKLGVVVLLQSAGKKSFRGFSLAQSPPLIFVNKDYGGGALRSFTLIHELAHLGSGTAGRFCYYDDTKQERWCNQVATEFLLPSADFISYIRSKKVRWVNSSDLDVVRLASNHYKASWLAVAIRLKEFGFADSSLEDHIRENFDVEKDPSTPVPGIDRSTPVLRGEEFGGLYLRSVRQAVASTRLSELEASRLLRSNAEQLHRLLNLDSRAG